uniref:Ubiquinone biosynthesis monooxygenase COQ7 n=1 Tax=Phytophthora ramorum TaxID=164328 RepID=H3GZE4_PHYRM
MMRKNRVMVLRLAGTRRVSSAASARRNWLEENCGDVPVRPYAQDADVSEMLRGGHALQVEGPVKTYSVAHLEKLWQLQETEQKAVRRLQDAGFRFRPSLVIPAVELSSFLVGGALGALGDKVSTSYVTGVKMAVSDYYNDQIREIYASKPNMVELKELFKVQRDEEQKFVDAHTPDILDPNKGSPDVVTTFAKASLKVLIQVAKAV